MPQQNGGNKTKKPYNIDGYNSKMKERKRRFRNNAQMYLNRKVQAQHRQDNNSGAQQHQADDPTHTTSPIGTVGTQQSIESGEGFVAMEDGSQVQVSPQPLPISPVSPPSHPTRAGFSDNSDPAHHSIENITDSVVERRDMTTFNLRWTSHIHVLFNTFHICHFDCISNNYKAVLAETPEIAAYTTCDVECGRCNEKQAKIPVCAVKCSHPEERPEPYHPPEPYDLLKPIIPEDGVVTQISDELLSKLREIYIDISRDLISKPNFSMFVRTILKSDFKDI